MKENEGTSDATAEAVEPFSTGRGPRLEGISGNSPVTPSSAWGTTQRCGEDISLLNQTVMRGPNGSNPVLFNL